MVLQIKKKKLLAQKGPISSILVEMFVCTSTSELGHNCFLSHPFQVIIHYASYHLTQYGLSY